MHLDSNFQNESLNFLYVKKVFALATNHHKSNVSSEKRKKPLELMIGNSVEREASILVEEMENVVTF